MRPPPSSLAWLRAFSAGSARVHLDEFVVRFNRRTSRSRGLLFYRLLQQAVVTGPVTYHRIAAGHCRDVQRIDHFVTSCNTHCQPIRWTATADSILEKLHRLCSRISGTGH